MRIRPANRPELEAAVDWAEAEGWDPGRGDAAAFWAADPGGFWVGELDGEVVATLSLVRQGPSFGFAGFYIVRPDLRGSGHGHALWRAVVDASPLRTIGLDGVPDQQGAYERSGFALAYRTTRYTGTLNDPGARHASFQTARMYRGPDPGLPVHAIYGVTSLELG